MTGNAPQRRDELLVTGIPPIADPLPETWSAPETVAEAAVRATAETRVAEPVFVDSTGWRGRLGRRLGLAAGAVLVVFLGALGLGMATGPDVPLTPWSEQSARPRVKMTPPDVPTEKPDEPGERRAAGAPRPEPTRRVEGTAPSAPPRSSREPSATPSRRPPPVLSTDRPGRSQASPPAWGRKKKDR